MIVSYMCNLCGWLFELDQHAYVFGRANIGVLI